MSELLNHIEEHPQDTRRLIGLDYTELQQLIQNAEKLHNEKQVLLENKKIRIIEKGGGRQSILSTQEQIILTLTYVFFILFLKVIFVDISNAWHSIWCE